LHSLIGSHLTPSLRGFVVGNQIPNLTPNPSFDHNSCILSINEQCKGTLGIYFKTILIVSQRPNLVLVYLLNQGYEHLGFPHECNSQSGNAIWSHWTSSFALSPICKSVFHIWTHSLGLMGSCTLHLIVNSMLRLWH